MPQFGGTGGPAVYYQATAPLNPANGDFWYDTSTSGVLNFRTQGSWVQISIPTTALDTLSNAVSVLSNAQSVLSNAVSVLSNSVSALSNSVSVISQAASVISADLVSINNKLSNAISVISQQVSVMSTTLSQLTSVVSQGLSLASQLISAMSVRVDVISTQVSVLSNVVSVISVGLGGLQLKVVAGVQGVSSTAGAGINVSGLSVSVATAAVYQLEGMVIYQTSATPATFGLGLNFPGMIAAAGTFRGGTTISQVTSVVVGQFNEDASNSMTFSIAVSTVSTMVANIDAVFTTSTAGTIQVLARVSATTQPVNIQKGSYIRAYKII